MNIVDRIISPNIWDEETKKGYYNSATGAHVNNANYLCSKNKCLCTPASKIYVRLPRNNNTCDTTILFYDINNNYIGWKTAYGANQNTWLIDVPNNAYSFNMYITDLYGTTYNHDICINESNPSINGKYFPYVMYKRYDMVDKPIYELPDGYIPTDIEVGGSYGVIDLGTLEWGKFPTVTNSSYFRATLNPLPKRSSSGTTMASLICSKYENQAGLYVYQAVKDNTIAIPHDNDIVMLYDSSKANLTPVQFKNSMQGIYLIYELANPLSPTLVRGNELNKYCISNGQIGVYNDTFKYNSNIPLKQWLRRLKIGG